MGGRSPGPEMSMALQTPKSYHAPEIRVKEGEKLHFRPPQRQSGPGFSLRRLSQKRNGAWNAGDGGAA